MNLSFGERPVWVPGPDDERPLGGDQALAVANGRLVQGGGREVGHDLAGSHPRAPREARVDVLGGWVVVVAVIVRSVSCSARSGLEPGRRASIRPAARDTGSRARWESASAVVVAGNASTRSAAAAWAEGHRSALQAAVPELPRPVRPGRAPARGPRSGRRRPRCPTDRRISASGHLEARAGHGQVGHHGRQLDQRLDAAQRFREREDRRRLADRDRALARGAPALRRRARTRPCPPPARIWRAAQAACGWACGPFARPG